MADHFREKRSDGQNREPGKQFRIIRNTVAHDHFLNFAFFNRSAAGPEKTPCVAAA